MVGPVDTRMHRPRLFEGLRRGLFRPRCSRSHQFTPVSIHTFGRAGWMPARGDPRRFPAHPGGIRHARRAVGRHGCEFPLLREDGSSRRSRTRPRGGVTAACRPVPHRGGRSETDVPTEQSQAQAQARVSSTDAHEVRQRGDQPPACERPAERLRVSVATGTGPTRGLGVGASGEARRTALHCGRGARSSRVSTVVVPTRPTSRVSWGLAARCSRGARGVW